MSKEKSGLLRHSRTPPARRSEPGPPYTVALPDTHMAPPARLPTTGAPLSPRCARFTVGTERPRSCCWGSRCAAPTRSCRGRGGRPRLRRRVPRRRVRRLGRAERSPCWLCAGGTVVAEVGRRGDGGGLALEAPSPSRSRLAPSRRNRRPWRPANAGAAAAAASEAWVAGVAGGGGRGGQGATGGGGAPGVATIVKRE